MIHHTNSAGRTLEILELIAQSRFPLSAAQISEELYLQRSATYRALSMLEKSGFITESGSPKKYSPSKKLFLLGHQHAYLSERLNYIKDSCREIEAKTKINCLGVIYDSNRVTIFSPGSYKDSPGGNYEIGRRQEITSTASGRSILAHLDPAIVVKHIEKGLVQHTDKTITSPFEYFKMLEKIRENGYAIEIEEARENIGCLGVPLIGLRGQPKISFLVIDNVTHDDHRKFNEYSKLVLEETRKVKGKINAFTSNR